MNLLVFDTDQQANAKNKKQFYLFSLIVLLIQSF